MSSGPLQKRLNRWTRKLHRWGAIIAAVPIVVILLTGLLLQLKKDWAWVQPPTGRGVGGAPMISMERILEIAIAVPEAGWSSRDDIDRLDVRLAAGIVKVRGRNRWEVQIDAVTGDVLSSTVRRSDLIESIHDGSWFHARAKLWVFLPAGAVLLALWLTGMYLWALPIVKRRRGRIRRAAAAAARSGGLARSVRDTIGS